MNITSGWAHFGSDIGDAGSEDWNFISCVDILLIVDRKPAIKK